MKQSSLPALIPVPFADQGTKNTIPVSSQIGISDGAASFVDGFPPLTMTPVAAGGIPPFGGDFNGILNAITLSLRWACAGGQYNYSSSFSNAVGGYPKGAMLQNPVGDVVWLNVTDDNTADPAAGNGWVPVIRYGMTQISLAGNNVTLTAEQAAKETIALSGALTANVSLILPAWVETWLIINNTTGNFTVSVRTASGSGVNLSAGTSSQIYGDGTNIYYGALMVRNNLAEIKAAGANSQATSRSNLGLGSAATVDVQTSQDDVTPGRVLVNGGALALRTVAASGGGGAYTDDCNNLPANSVSFVYGSAKNSPGFEASVLDFSGLGGTYRTQIAASYSDGGKRISIRTCNGDNQTWNVWKPILTSDGGSVNYLDNAWFYKTRVGMWQGGGAFAQQLIDGTAPFYAPNFIVQKDMSMYLPICKGSSQTDTYGYTSTVSFGILRSGNADFGSAVIHIIGDSGKSATLSFTIDGDLNVPHQVNGVNIVASGGVFESGGAVRVYSPNNPPPGTVPAGTPLPWPGASEPPGWSFCVGQGFNTSLYPQLAAVYPSGVLPDLRGLFIRGLDAYRGVDPGRNTLLSLQYSQAPRSAMSGYGTDNWNTYAAGTGYFIRTGTDNEGRYQILAETEAQRETRPINMAFNYIVRLA